MEKGKKKTPRVEGGRISPPPPHACTRISPALCVGSPRDVTRGVMDTFPPPLTSALH